jgi:serine protease Do
MRNCAKKIACFACAALMATTAIGLAACEDEKVINAYDIAVQNGFVGTEQDWLLSLQGANGKDGEDLDISDLYEAAKQNGFDGTLLQFIQSMDIAVPENNDTQTIAKNITSVVSVCCAFEQKRVVGNYWNRYEETTITGAEGSGVVVHIEKNRGVAYVVTNYHVVYNTSAGISDCIWLYPYGARDTFTTGSSSQGIEPGDLADGDGIQATFIGGAMDYDIALLQINSADLPDSLLTAAEFGDSNDVTVGEKAFAIGNANGLGISATSGIISVESEDIKMTSTDGLREVYYRVMRTDAAINHGNSGGGLFNAAGQLVGITNAKSVADETDNMGYALPITQVKYLLQNIWENKTEKEAGYVLRAFLGIETYIQSSKAQLVDGKLHTYEDFLVSKILDNGAVGTNSAETLKVGDVFLSATLNGVTTVFTQRYQLNDFLLNVRKGDTVTFTVLRDGSVTGKVETQVDVTFDKDEHFVKYA